MTTTRTDDAPLRARRDYRIGNVAFVGGSVLISHRLPLAEAPTGYKNFRDNQNEWTKVVLKPH